MQLGCGMTKHKRAIGVDINPKSAADVIHDLNVFPYPFPNNFFDGILAENILEHLDDVVKVMEELHRIAKPNAIITITTGHFSSVDSFTDPTHKHFFTSRSFDYFVPGSDLFKYGYSPALFKKRLVRVGSSSYTNIFLHLLMKFINKHLIWYEKRFAFIFPAGAIMYQLEAVKAKTDKH